MEDFYFNKYEISKLISITHKFIFKYKKENISNLGE